jgi:hypothetical protein
MQARFKMFQSGHEPWEMMFQRAADFMTKLGPEYTIGVSHSHESTVGVVTVWYWFDETLLAEGKTAEASGG